MSAIPLGELTMERSTARRIPWMSSYVLLLLLFLSSFATSRSIVKTLPGFDGDLPFKLETGSVNYSLF
jgi:hypothetical protein